MKTDAITAPPYWFTNPTLRNNEFQNAGRGREADGMKKNEKDAKPSASHSNESQNAEGGRQTDDTKKNEKSFAPLNSTPQTPSVSEMRKNALRMRLGLLKKQVEGLVKFSRGNPDAINPRLIKQLARELKALVAEYGRLCRSTAGGAPNISVRVSVDQPGEQAVAAMGDASSAAVAAAAAAAEAESAPPTSEAEIQQVLAAAAQAADQSTSGADGKIDEEDNDSDKKSGIGETNTRGSSGNAEDRAFLEVAKKVAQMLKALLKTVKAASNEEEAKEIKKAKKEIEDLEETIRKVEESLFGGQTVGADLALEAGNASVPEVTASMPVFISTYA